MKQFILTSTSFTGEVRVVYGEDGHLALINYEGASFDPDKAATQIQWIKERVPVAYGPQFLQFCQVSRLTAVAEDYEITFDMFWEAYKNKVNRKRALAKWERLSKTNRCLAYAGIKAYKRHLDRNPWKNEADPDTYLGDRYWENQWK